MGEGGSKTSELSKSAHPLDGRDEDDCDKTMMSERTILITARRESEDNLIKTIIQLASALVVLMAGFITQSHVVVDRVSLIILAISLTALGMSIVAGLAEQFLSSKAYQEQQQLLEQFYTKQISSFSEAPSNRKVRASQGSAFVLFVLALFTLGVFALAQAKGKTDANQQPAAPASAAPAPASASAAPAAPAFASAPASPAADRGWSPGKRHKVSGAPDAAGTAQEGLIRNVARPTSN